MASASQPHVCKMKTALLPIPISDNVNVPHSMPKEVDLTSIITEDKILIQTLYFFNNSSFSSCTFHFIEVTTWSTGTGSLPYSDYAYAVYN